MPFRRDIVLDADPATTYDALREVVAPNLEGNLFEITVDEPDVEFGIAYIHLISSSHYRFSIEPLENGTRLEARMWLGGLIGPLQSILRFWTHNRHLEKLLDGVDRRVLTIQAQDDALEQQDDALDAAEETPPVEGDLSSPDAAGARDAGAGDPHSRPDSTRPDPTPPGRTP